MKKDILDSGGQAPAYPISSVGNALRLILLFREKRAVRLTEACQYLDVAHSTAHRLLAMLAYHGFVRQDPGTRAYYAGPALVEVGLAVVKSLDVRDQARPFLEELAAEFGETAHLGVLEGADVRYLDAVESKLTLRVTARTGSLIPAHCTSLGKALLAELSPDAVCELYPEDARLSVRTDHSITSWERLEEEVRRVRERGYALNREESEDGVGSVAMAFPELGRPTVAIAIAAPLSRLSDQRAAQMGTALTALAERLRTTAPA